MSSAKVPHQPRFPLLKPTSTHFCIRCDLGCSRMSKYSQTQSRVPEVRVTLCSCSVHRHMRAVGALAGHRQPAAAAHLGRYGAAGGCAQPIGCPRRRRACAGAGLAAVPHPGGNLQPSGTTTGRTVRTGVTNAHRGHEVMQTACQQARAWSSMRTVYPQQLELCRTCKFGWSPAFLLWSWCTLDTNDIAASRARAALWQ